MHLAEIAGGEEGNGGPGREISVLAHTLISDLRSPLAAFRAGAELLTRYDLSPAQSQRLARDLLMSAARIEEILVDLASQVDVVPRSELLRNPEKIPEIRKHPPTGRREMPTDRIWAQRLSERIAERPASPYP